MKGLKRIIVCVFIGLLAIGFLAAKGQDGTAQSDVPVLSYEEKGFGNYKVWSTLQEYEEETGEKIRRFNESPFLKSVADLPSVKERLPEEPLVISPVDEIGQYGGIIWDAYQKPLSSRTAGWLSYYNENLLCRSPDLKDVMPNIAKSYEVSEDGKVFTFYLRKGMKWSDGHPFTADDFIFGYNDMLLNKELFPNVSSRIAIDGEPGKIEKIDDYSFKISFHKSYGLFLEGLIHYGFQISYPKHYLMQFHPAYTSKDTVEALMKKEGFDQWNSFIKNKINEVAISNAECPSIRAFIPAQVTTESVDYFVRNPYFWKIDTEGNQLPYIDEQKHYTNQTAEVLLLQAMGGELTISGRGVQGNMDNYKQLMQNREKGNYDLVQTSYSGTTLGTLHLNMFHKDPVLRKLFRDVNFRIALSIAIDRDEINEYLYEGMGYPCQPTPTKGTPWFEERLKEYYTEYDSAKANQILDEMGLEWDAKHEYRMRPDGERLRLTLYVVFHWPVNTEIGNLIKENYWKEIGIEVVIKPTGSDLWVPTMQSDTFDIMCSYSNMGWVARNPITRGEAFPTSNVLAWAREYVAWFNSDGKEGEEPPKDIKRVKEIRDLVVTETSALKRNALITEAMELHAKNMWFIGIIEPPRQTASIVVSNKVGNYPGHNLIEANHYSEYSTQWYIKQ